jgi:transposase
MTQRLRCVRRSASCVRRLVKLTLEELRVIEDHLGQLAHQMAALLSHHHEAVHRLAEVPGLGVDSAQQIIAEVGATAATFPSAKHLASWMGACPAPRRARAKTTVIAARRATARCDVSSTTPQTPP